jgi:mannitol/fructose-specific phosphotransferase system IIA component (Ntr-type)
VKLQDILQKNCICIDLPALDKADLLTQMAKFLAAAFSLPDADGIVAKILQRESEMSTGIGYGIAIPHSRITGIDRLYIVAARTAGDIEFDAIDELPVRLVFMMISPANTTSEHTQILSTLSKIVSSEQTRQQLQKAQNAEEFLTILVTGENALG